MRTTHLERMDARRDAWAPFSRLREKVRIRGRGGAGSELSASAGEAPSPESSALRPLTLTLSRSGGRGGADASRLFPILGAHPHRRGGRDGFLLVEAISALALGALILVALLALTGLLRRSADRAAWGVEMTEVTGRTVDTIAQEVRRAARRKWAVPPEAAVGAKPTPKPVAPAAASNDGPDSDSGRVAPSQDANAAEGEGQAEQEPERPFAFAGAPDRVMFALTPTQPSGLRAPVFVVYQIDSAGAVLRAEGALTPDALGPAGVTLGPVSRIDPGPERLKFAFVDRQPSGDEVIVDAWTEPMRMPAAVRIDRIDPATGLVKSALRVPLLIDGEPGCAGKSGQCSRVEDKGDAGGAGTPSPQNGAAPAQQDQQ